MEEIQEIEVPTELQEDTTFLNRVLTTAPYSIYVYNLEHKDLTYANSYLGNVLGYTPRQMIDSGDEFLLKLIHPDDSRQLDEHYGRMADLQNGQSRSIEFRFKHAKGTWKWLHLNETVLRRDGKGEVQQILGNGIDVTEKKEKEGKPEENPDFIKSVMDTTPGNIFLVDAKVHRVLFDSLNALRTLGYTSKDMIGFGDQVLPQLLHPDDFANLDAAFKELDESKTDENITYVVRFRHADGSWRWFNITIRAFKRDAQGALSQAVGVAIDITPQKEAEIQLKESKEFIEKLVVTTPGNIFLLDTIEFKVLFDSLNALKTLGYSPDDIKGVGNEFFPQMLHPEDAEIPRVAIQKLREFKTDENLSYVARFRHANGSWRWFNVTLRPFKRDDKGTVREAVGVAIDITAQKEAEIQLKENKGFVEKLLATTPGNIFLFDTIEYKVLFDSMNALISFGYSPDELKEMGNEFFPKMLHPDDVDIPKVTIQKLKEFKTDENLSYEARFRHSNGSWRWFNITLRPFKRDDKGIVREAVGVAIDINGQKEAELRLKENKEFVDKIISTSPNDIFVFDLIENKNVFASRNLLSVLGYAPDQVEELGDQFLFKLLYTEDTEVIKNTFQTLKEFKIDQTLSIEVRLRRADGNYHWISVNSRPFRIEKGELSQIVMSAIDIAARKKAEEELKELNNTLEKKVTERTQELQKSEENLMQRENQLRLITNAIPALISYIDQNEIYRFTNPSYQNLFFVSKDITDKKVKDVLVPEVYNVAKENIKKALEGEVISYENRVPMKDGSIRTFNVNFIPDKDEWDHTRGIVVLGIDLTDRIEYEKNLENKNIELKMINADLDNFIYTASHDLKAPIANLEGLLRSMMDELNEQISEVIRMMMNMMMISIKRLQGTITELTEISKIQRDHGEQRGVLDINEMIEEFKADFARQIRESNAVIQTYLNVPNILFARKNFRSIIYNLLDNAIKYRSPERAPEIIIKTERINDQNVLLTVKDNGLGFDISKKDKVFGMFKRLHTHIEGTGIGLYIVKRIVENEGGKVDVESEVNKGSVFKIYFKV